MVFAHTSGSDPDVCAKKKKLTISRTLLGSAHSYAPVPSLRVDESILHQTAESCVPWVRPIRMRKKNKHDPQY